MPLTKKNPIRSFAAVLMIWLIMVLPVKSVAQTTNNAFGDSIPVSNGLAGKIYLLPDTTTMLPEFDAVPALKTQ